MRKAGEAAVTDPGSGTGKLREACQSVLRIIMASKNNTSQQRKDTFLGKSGTGNPLGPPPPPPIKVNVPRGEEPFTARPGKGTKHAECLFPELFKFPQGNLCISVTNESDVKNESEQGPNYVAFSVKELFGAKSVLACVSMKPACLWETKALPLDV